MSKVDQIRKAAEADLVTFVKVISPETVLGHVHIDFLQWLQSKETKSHKLGLLPRDHQKLLPLTEPVLTPDGWVETGKLKVGDYVFGSDGLPQKVIGLNEIIHCDMYEVTTRDGRKVKCHEGHLWTVQCPSSTGNKWVTKTLRDILKNWKVNRSDKRNGEEYTEYRYFIPTVKPIQFTEKDLPIDPYVLGCWLGDGHSKGATLTTADEEIVDNIKAAGFAVSKHKSSYNYGILGLHELLRQSNLLNNKHVPEIYLQGSLEQRLSLLQGLMDTEGSVHIAGRWAYISQCVKRENICEALIALVRSLGGSATKSLMNSKLDGISFPSYSVTIKLPRDLNPFRLQRKASKFLGNPNTRSAIVSIEKVGKDYGRCISVENPDGLYVTKDYTLTHNSRMAAFYVLWQLAKRPDIRILYISSTSNLAEKQLKFIKDKLESKLFAKFWPDHVNPEEGKRSKWTNGEIELDHPIRVQEGIRDPSVFTAGLTTSITGMHCDLAVLDDVVVFENAYTEEGRKKVSSQVSLLTSIEGAEAEQLCVGTRYHPRDIYGQMMEMEYDKYDDVGNVIGSEQVYSVFQRVVEENGEYLWPRQQRPSDGKWFGFDAKIIGRKKAQYVDKTQFYAQYYNNPNAPDGKGIPVEKFQYYDRSLLKQSQGKWFYGSKRLNVYAAIDFAFKAGRRNDYTAIAVIGIDHDRNIYVLDIDRFKTELISEYFDHIRTLYLKWGFRKLRCEVIAAQYTITRDLKENYLKPQGLNISIDEYRPSQNEGTKAERISNILQPRYDNQQIWHYRGGNCQVLEDELILENPPHDDCKDVLAMACDVAVPPISNALINRTSDSNVVQFHPRFGGVA